MKQTPFFSHDANARNDEKIVKLRMKHDWKGYGLYWAIVEKLRESTDYRLTTDYNLLAFDLRADNEIIRSIVTGFGLFTIDDETFTSQSLCDRMLLKDEKSNLARQSANARWEKEKKVQEKRGGNATAMRPHSDGNANKVKEVKESKGGSTHAPARKPSEVWAAYSLDDRQGWVASELKRLTAEKLPDPQCAAEAVQLLQKKPEANYAFINSWAKNLLESLERRPAPARVLPDTTTQRIKLLE